MISRLRLPHAAALPFGEARRFAFDRNSEKREGFLLRHRSGWFAYVNCCPHWHVDLDMGDGQFYAAEVDRIFCKNHGALFRVHDGVCDFGPCIGQGLEPLGVKIEGDDAWIELAP